MATAASPSVSAPVSPAMTNAEKLEWLSTAKAEAVAPRVDAAFSESNVSLAGVKPLIALIAEYASLDRWGSLRFRYRARCEAAVAFTNTDADPPTFPGVAFRKRMRREMTVWLQPATATAAAAAAPNGERGSEVECDSIAIAPTTVDGVSQPAHWQAAIYVPPASNPYYGGGIFHCTIKLSIEYPFRPMRIDWLTPVHHPSLLRASGGRMELGDSALLHSDWSPAHYIPKVVLALREILLTPNEPATVFDFEVDKQLRTKPAKFLEIAKEMTLTHAVDPETESAL